MELVASPTSELGVWGLRMLSPSAPTSSPRTRLPPQPCFWRVGLNEGFLETRR